MNKISKERQRETKKSLIAICIACYGSWKTPIELAEEIMKSLENYEDKIKKWKTVEPEIESGSSE